MLNKIKSFLKRVVKKLRSSTDFFIWLFFGFFLSIVVVIYFLSISVFNAEPKHIIVMNFLPEESRVYINEKEYLLKPLEILNTNLDTFTDIHILVKNPRNEVIQDITLKSVGIQEKVSITVLSEKSDYCFFKADVESIYFSNEDIDSVLNKLFTIKTNHYNMLFETLNEDTFYIYPSKSNLSDLPSELKTKGVIGFYPIPCEHQDSFEFKKEIIKTYLEFNSSDQYSLLIDKLNKIANAKSIEELNNI